MKNDDHYFSPHPESPHRPRSFEEALGGERFFFDTDGGTFSGSRLDPGSRLLIETAKDLPDFPEKGRILDLGAGWGPVGIILSRFYPQASWTFLEVNERALELARTNFQKNGAKGKAEFLRADGLSGSGRCEAPVFDLILQNPPIRAGKEVIYRLFREAQAALHPGGRFLAVMRKKQGVDSAVKELRALYGENAVETIARGSGFHVILARKGKG